MRIDRVVLGIVVLGALLGAVLANAQSEVDSTPGLLAARAWLNDLDTGRYGRAYDEASPTLQGSMTRVQWETGLERGRGRKEMVEQALLGVGVVLQLLIESRLLEVDPVVNARAGGIAPRGTGEHLAVIRLRAAGQRSEQVVAVAANVQLVEHAPSGWRNKSD